MIPIQIQPFFWLIAALIGWLGTSSLPLTIWWMGIILISVVIHEMGHALTALFFGQRARITLGGMGGYTQRTGKKLSLWKEFFIVFNGPLAGLLLALLAYSALVYQLFAAHSMATYLLEVIASINIFWTIFNLCPVQPLDGGRLLSIFLEAIFGPSGIRLALFTSMLFAGILGALSFGIGLFIAGILFFLFAFENYRLWSAYRPEAIVKAEEEGKALLREGKVQEAFNLLIPIRERLSPEWLPILYQLSFTTGHLKVAAELGDRVYEESPVYEVALTNAICHALLGQKPQAIGWLHSAKERGGAPFKEALLRAEFDALRDDPAFKALEHVKGEIDGQ